MCCGNCREFYAVGNDVNVGNVICGSEINVVDGAGCHESYLDDFTRLEMLQDEIKCPLANLKLREELVEHLSS